VRGAQGGGGTGTTGKPAIKGILRTESGVEIPPAHFDHLLTFPEEIAPVFDMLRDEHEERRLLDHVRNREATRYLERLNDELDAAQRERQESDILLDKINNTRLDALQKKLVRLITKGFRELHEELGPQGLVSIAISLDEDLDTPGAVAAIDSAAARGVGVSEAAALLGVHTDRPVDSPSSPV